MNLPHLKTRPPGRYGLWAILLLSLFYGLPLRAAQEAAQKTVTAPVIDFTETTSTAIILLKVFGALLLVVGLLALLTIWLKKLGLSQSGSYQGSLIKVLDTKMIAPKKYVVVVKVAEKNLALGVTDQQVSLLTALEEDVIIPSPPSSAPAQAPFSTLLGKVLKRNEQ